MRAATVPPVGAESDLGQAVILRVSRRCQVSEQAARVCLVKLGLLNEL
jgi:hypothetical protein